MSQKDKIDVLQKDVTTIKVMVGRLEERLNNKTSLITAVTSLVGVCILGIKVFLFGQ